MIYTITLNPAIDHIILSNKPVELGVTNYYGSEYQVVGGKGINAGVILNNLNANVKAIGIMGNDNKELFLNKFNEVNLKNEFHFNPGNTRVNYKIKHLESHQETELNGLGFETKPKVIEDFLKYLENNLKADDIVIATGSVARGIDRAIYKQIGDIVNNKSALLVCDAANDLLKNALSAKPYLIKPNIEEICSTLGLELKNDISFEEEKKLIKSLQDLGAQNVLLSKGSQGSLFFTKEGQVYQVGIAKGKLVNSVGAGDSMLAGFVYGISENMPIEKTLQYAAASGAATAFNEWLASKEEIISLIDQISVNKK
ncbi:1-phosphofructokinase [Spiroplasma helicoides]|uniref:1-phosphofructokinase n=1 Tax=Spiroplasma helicoides TaxID=216938 RepID=A0A1B3SKY7_9MOLU|nr:1-phosphofructokinase family hexose kinase [Spiroplasma helicoides]AOG60583.1 1-phosphofructokinase [Spiroplasma helicoides]